MFTRTLSGIRNTHLFHSYIDLPKPKQTEAVNLLQSWLDSEDEEEQQKTGEYLIQVLDGDRLSERQLFPAELKGITW